MATIDKGEKHLFRRRLLDSSDNPIVWDDVVDITFELSLFGERTVQTWTKSNAGGVTKDEDYVKFEYDSSGARTGDYYIKATIVVADFTWENDVSDDVTWETDKITIVDTPTPYNTASSTADIKFDVDPEDVTEPPANPPTQGAFTPLHTTANTASLPFTPVNLASFYEYELESGGGVVRIGDVTSVNLSNLTPDTTDRWRVRAGNVIDVSDFSPYQEFTTNPSVAPVIDGAITTDTNSASFTLVDEGLGVQYFRDGEWAGFGVATSITISNLAENTEFTFPFRYANAGGRGLDANGVPLTTDITFSTQQALPSTAPTITQQSVTDTTATFSRTSVAGADDYEASIDSGAYTSVGLLSNYTLTGRATNTTFTHVLRATNDGGDGPDSNELTTLTLPGTVTLTEVVVGDTTYTFNISAISGQSNVDYFVTLDGGSTYTAVNVGENTITGLTPETPYDIQPEARNASGSGDLGAVTSFTTRAVLEPPTSVSTSTDITKFSETITLASGATSSEYRIDGGTWVSIGTDTSYEVELDAGDHTRELRSVDGAGPSSPSATLSFTIPATIDGVETQTLSFEVIA